MRINSRSGIGGRPRVTSPAPVVEEPIINEVEGIEEVIEDDDEEDISEDGGVG